VRKAFEKGPIAGVEVTDEAFDWAKRRYYELMGWNSEGVPGAEAIERLKLDLLGLELSGV